MQNVVKCGMLGLMCLVSVCAWGLTTDTQHYFGFDLGGGYSMLNRDVDACQIIGGGTGTVGLVYELKHDRFWFGTGVDYTFFSDKLVGNCSSSSPWIYDRADIRDNQGKDITMHYAMSHYQEWTKMHYIGIPIMVGFQLDNGFYMGVGAKVGLCVRASTDAQIDYSTSGTYERYVADFENMPNHYYGDYSSDFSSSLKTNVKGSALFEIGCDLAAARLHSPEGQYKKVSKARTKVGAYLEYGFQQISDADGKNNLAFISPQTNAAHRLNMNTLYKPYGSSHWVSPICVGVKLTVLFSAPEKTNCNCEHHGL